MGGIVQEVQSQTATQSIGIAIQNTPQTDGTHYYQIINDYSGRLSTIEEKVKQFEEREKDYLSKSVISSFWRGITVFIILLGITTAIIGYFISETIQSFQSVSHQNTEDIKTLIK